MKKLISTKMKIFMSILLIGSITSFISAFVVLSNSGYKLSNYKDDFENFIYNIRYDNFNYHRNFDNNSIVFESDCSQINSLNINLGNYDVDVETSYDTDKLTVFAEYDFDISSNNILLSNLTNGSLNLTSFNGLNSNDVYYKIIIPATFKGELAISTANGYISLNNLNANNITVKSLNSDITLTNNVTDAITVSLTNGNIYSYHNSAKSIEINSINSEIAVEDKVKDIKVDNTNGDIVIIASEEIKNCNVNNVSGDVEFYSNVNRGFELAFETVSGEFENNAVVNSFTSNFNKYKATKGDPEATIFIKTVSGDFELY